MLGQVPRSWRLTVVHLTSYKSWDDHPMLLGGAGLTAVLCTYPLDLARARMVGGPMTPHDGVEVEVEHSREGDEFFPVRNDPKKDKQRGITMFFTHFCLRRQGCFLLNYTILRYTTNICTFIHRT